MNGKILIVEDEFIIAEDLRKILEKAGYEISGIAPSVPKALEIIKLKRPAWVFVDIQLTGKLTGLDLAVSLNELEIPFIYVSANSNQSVLELAKATKPYGFMVKPFREKDVLVALDIAIYRHENNLEAKLVKEVALQSEVLQVMESSNDWRSQMSAIMAAFHRHITFDYFAVCWEDENHGKNEIAFLKDDGGSFEFLSVEELAVRVGKTEQELYAAKASGVFPEEAVYYGGNDFEYMLNQNPFRKIIAREFELGSVLMQPVELPKKRKFLCSFYNRDSHAFKQEHVAWLERLQLLLIQVGDKLLSYHTNAPVAEVQQVNDTVYEVLVPAVETSLKSEEFGLVGSSDAFDNIKEQLSVVAPFDISVLILGESGTGKERVAQAIHRLSDRKAKPLVKVNCAAIPAALMESELFGHEKGAFTSAINRRIGKFEEAIGGTIFLDEIGELPLDLQVKLLCVLQEKEIVRVGGNQIIKTDVRVIAATNRNLEKEVAEGRFRLDLYYRLNVFPLTLPPLRKRKEDIAELSAHFLKNLSKKMGKNVTSMSDQVGYALQAYEWPGNIRELENIIERGILLTSGPVLTRVDLPEKTLQEAAANASDTPIKTFKEMEKDYIFSVLKKCGGRIGGPGGAAEMLDLAPTTLISKMNKLGIVKKFTA